MVGDVPVDTEVHVVRSAITTICRLSLSEMLIRVELRMCLHRSGCTYMWASTFVLYLAKEVFDSPVSHEKPPDHTKVRARQHECLVLVGGYSKHWKRRWKRLSRWFPLSIHDLVMKIELTWGSHEKIYNLFIYSDEDKNLYQNYKARQDLKLYS